MDKNIQKIRELFVALDLRRSRLIITDYNTGAGYITVDNDQVFVRWGHVFDGIRFLEYYNNPPTSGE